MKNLLEAGSPRAFAKAAYGWIGGAVACAFVAFGIASFAARWPDNVFWDGVTIVTLTAGLALAVTVIVRVIILCVRMVIFDLKSGPE